MKKGLQFRHKAMLAFIFIMMNAFMTTAQTNTYSGATGGNWNTGANWSLGIVPTAAHDVVIPNNRDVTINTAAVCGTFTINGGNAANTISIGSNSLTVTGTVTINAPTADSTTKIIDVQTGTLTCGAVVMASTTVNTRDCRIRTTTGTVTVTGNITMNGVPQRNQLRINGSASSGGTLNVGGSLSGGDLLSNNENSTVNFNGTSAQVIPMNSDYIYNKITVNNTAGATLQAAITATNVTDDISVQSGFLDNGGFAIAGNAAKTFSISNGATFKLSGTTSSFPSGFGTVTAGATSTVEYKGTGAQTVFDIASPGYGNLTISSNSVKTAAAGIDLQGTVTVNNTATLALSSYTHSIGGNLSNVGTLTMTTGTLSVLSDLTSTGTFTAGTASTVSVTGNLTNSGTFTAGTGASNLNVKGNWSNSGTFTCGSAGTVTLNGTATGKTITGTTSGTTGKFYNLTLNGTGGAWTASNAVDVANNLTLTNGSLTANGTLSIAGSSALAVGAGAALTIQSDASLIQSGYTGANTGTVTVKRNSAKMILDDFTYWSSPVSGTQTLLNFSPSTQADKYFTYNNAWLYENNSNMFTKGVGYAIQSPQGISSSSPAAIAFQFTGTPNNGTISVPVTVGERLVGNPYPSALDAVAFINANVVGLGSVNQTISGALYFWTHNHSLTGNNYSSSDYAIYTKLGGTGVSAGTGNITTPTQFMASAQGFFVEVVAAGNITFNNTMRNGPNNTNFYRHSNPEASPMDQTNRAWINMTNSTASFSQALIGYTDQATDAYDPGYDGKFYGTENFVLYSILDTNILSIQARALPFTDTDMVPLGYKSDIAGSVTIALDHYDGIFENGQDIYLEDLLLGIIHDLKASPYVFDSEAGTFDNRFILRYNNQVLGIENPQDDNIIQVAAAKDRLSIKSEQTPIGKVTVFDILGRKVFERKNLGTNSFSVSNMGLGNQAYVVKIDLADGKTLTRKVLL